MCGITGFRYFAKNVDLKESLTQATAQLTQRGPDNQQIFTHENTGLGHSRLAIIDTSSKANQPMHDRTGRYTLVFNGEIYNYQTLADQLEVNFTSTSDTEVLLYLLIKEDVNCLNRLNGFFAFAFYDHANDTLLIARDRMGIKPLHYYFDDQFFAFGSEMKALMQYPFTREVNQESLYWYLRLTYLPHDRSMLKGVRKLLPGHYLKVSKEGVDDECYWKLNDVPAFEGTYDEAKQQTITHLEQSVQRRLIADVPLGSFLSGGTDSSAVVAMAAKFAPSLHTYSIGYRDHDFFDETNYAELVAQKFNTNHTTFSLTNDDLLNSLESVLDYIDEPFADSSAIPTFILSKQVRKHIKVALSGDGADELFGGYYKHLAFQRSREKSLANTIIHALTPLVNLLPKTRSSFTGNLARRISKYSQLQELSDQEKYWMLASFNTKADQLMVHPTALESQLAHVGGFDNGHSFDLNEFLDLDLKMVLPGDMLTKVDLMSMANSLEVRVPFLDKDLVAFARSLPPHYKVNKQRRKTVLQDAFEHILPKELHHRAKKGFEVPMLHWLRNELFERLEKEVLDPDFLADQKLFAPDKVMELKQHLMSKNPGDTHATLWTLLVFQKWYKKWMV